MLLLLALPSEGPPRPETARLMRGLSATAAIQKRTAIGPTREVRETGKESGCGRAANGGDQRERFGARPLFMRHCGSYSSEKIRWTVSARPGPGSRSASSA